MADEQNQNPGNPGKSSSSSSSKVHSKAEHVAGMEHLEDSELVYVEVVGPVHTRRDPTTGRVREYGRGKRLHVTRKEFDAVNHPGIATKPLKEVEEDEGK